jgi:hypothetical protein
LLGGRGRRRLLPFNNQLMYSRIVEKNGGVYVEEENRLHHLDVGDRSRDGYCTGYTNISSLNAAPLSQYLLI